MVGRWLGLAALVIGAAVAPRVVATAAPLAAYGKLPSIEGAALSPNGKMVAYVVTDGEKRAIIVKDLASGQFVFRTLTGDAKVRRVQWAGDGYLVATASQTAIPLDVIGRRGEYYQAFGINLATGRMTGMLRDSGASGTPTMNIITGAPIVRSVDGVPTVFLEGVSFVGGSGRSTLFRVSMERVTSRIVEIGGDDVQDWLLGADGQPVAQQIYDDNSSRWSLRVKQQGRWQEVASVAATLDPPNLLGISADGKAVLYDVRDDKGQVVWREVRLDGGEPGPGKVHPETDAPLHDPANGRLVGEVGLVGDDLRYTFYDPDAARIWKTVTETFAGDLVSLVSWSQDRTKLAVEVDSAARGPGYAVIDLNARSATWLGPEYADVKPDDISPRQAIRYKAADGLEITGYLTLPRGRPRACR